MFHFVENDPSTSAFCDDSEARSGGKAPEIMCALAQASASALLRVPRRGDGRPFAVGRAVSSRRTPVGLLLIALMLGGAGPAAAEDDPHGLWAPADGRPLSAAVADSIPRDGADCVDDAVRNAQFDIAVIADSLTGGAGMQLSRYKEAFARCMVKKGWRRVDPAEFSALRIQGQLADCQAGAAALCPTAVNLYVHGVAGYDLDARLGLETGRKLCEAGNADVCLTVASLYLRPPEGRGLAANPKQAVKMAVRGCDKGDAECCGFAGVLLSTEAAGEYDPAKGRRLLDLACARGQRSACTWPEAPPPETIATDLPAGSRWCRYGAPVRRGPETCPEAPVSWIAHSDGAVCEPRMSLDIGSCHYDFRIGN